MSPCTTRSTTSVGHRPAILNDIVGTTTDVKMGPFARSLAKCPSGHAAVSPLACIPLFKIKGKFSAAQQGRKRRLLIVAAALICLPPAVEALGAPEYHPIVSTEDAMTVTLTGHDLTIEQLVAVARHGAKVQYGPGVLQSASEARSLLLEAAAEELPVYGFNRGGGALREVSKPKGAPDASLPPWLNTGVMPEVTDEDIVRAMMVISANEQVYTQSEPAASQMLIDFLNKRITPVMYSRGSLGEADGPISGAVNVAIAGHGDVYYRGVRMRATEAFQQAGLKLLPEGANGAAIRVGEAGDAAENAYGDALAALLVSDGRHALEWADLIYALDKIGMNSSLTPMTTPVQAKRPFKWVNWDAARVMNMLKGSYLFEDDPKRILQDPESMRASYIRQGSAWQAWAALRDSVLLQINSSDRNPMVIVGASPGDSWELSTPQMMKYYVKGGALSHGLHGYVFSTANWDPYPLANDVEAFTNAVANLDAAVAQRIERFSDRSPTAFFTGIKPADVLTPEQLKASPALSEPYFVFMDLWAEIQNLSRSITPEGNAADVGVADIEAFTRLKGSRGREVVDLTLQLLGYDLLTATYWLDVRKAEDSKREFGRAPTAVWEAFRKILPWQKDPLTRPEVPFGIVAYTFLRSNAATSFEPFPPDERGGDGKKLDGSP